MLSVPLDKLFNLCNATKFWFSLSSSISAEARESWNSEQNLGGLQYDEVISSNLMVHSFLFFIGSAIFAEVISDFRISSSDLLFHMDLIVS